ncbi:MAG: hypothetical protein JWR40_333 [Massilia sp.]|jgi:hypothetical protein|nr:hypothetical protein [Massilia sp.]MDB5950439.1 hypothetical protein [Massilia sp.]
MKLINKLVLVSAIGAAMAFGATASFAAAPAAPAAHAPKAKNWTPPAHKIYAQKLSEEIMAKHPELISVTFHGTPPGSPAKLYTMYAGSLLDRIGNVDDFDDVMVIETGITILDPRWHRTTDPVKKFLSMLPMRDKAGENIGLLVLAYKVPFKGFKNDHDYYKASIALRDGLQKKIASHVAMFDEVK